MPDEIRFFMPIAKVDKEQRMVWGYASTEALDLDGEIVSKGAVEKALPAYMEWRNVREMHRNSAVGVAKETNVDDKGLYLGAKIRDDDAWAKCVPDDDGHRVYNGFSIGGRKIAKSGNTITELELIEISLVDRPANPECRIEVSKAAKVGKSVAFLNPEADDLALGREEIGLFGKLLARLAGGSTEKREFSEKERDAAAQSGAALPDGSFPIKSKKDLENAIQAHDRAKNKARAKRHIVRRANALGLTEHLPEGWAGAKGKSDKLAKGAANLYMVGRMIELLGSLESCEENLEMEGCFFGSAVPIDKTLTDRFGSLLIEFADLTAEILDVIIRAMDEEEAGEAVAETAKLAKAGGERNRNLLAVIKTLGGADAVADLDRNDDDPFVAISNLKGAFTMTTPNTELAKRVAAMHKQSITKAAHHMAEATKCYGAGMSSLGKAAKCMTAAKAAAKAADAEAGNSEAAGHLAKAAEHFGAMSDHQDIAAHHINKVASSWGTGTGLPTSMGGGIEEPGQPALTEGEVPEYDAVEPYPGKGAGLTAEAIGKLVAESIEKALAANSQSKLEKGIEDLTAALSRMPAGAPRARLFAVDKSAFAGVAGEGDGQDAMAKLMNGVTVDQQDPDSVNAAAGKMIGNMIAAGMSGDRRFGRDVFSDPTFRGGAVRKTN
jgi:HK97 family phage prohead protease